MLINFEENWKWGYYNSDTHNTIPAQFYDNADFVDGYAIVKHDYNTSYGVINENGDEVLPFVFSQITYLGNDLFEVGNRNCSCIYNKDGKIVDASGEELKQCLQDYNIVQNIDKELYHVLTKDNTEGIVYGEKEILAIDVYREIKEVHDGMIVLGGGSGHRYLYDFAGKELLSDYQDYSFISNKYIIVYAGYDRGYGILDSEFNVKVEAKYSHITYIGEDVFCLTYKENSKSSEKNVKYDACKNKFILDYEDMLYEVQMPSYVDWCNILAEDLYLIISQGKYGLLTSTAKSIVSTEYEEIKLCDNSVNVICQKDKLYYLVNLKSGVCSNGYHKIEPVSNNYFRFKDHNFGIIDFNTNVVLPDNYDSTLGCLDHNMFFATYRENKYYINSNAQIVVGKDIALPKDIIKVGKFSDGLAIIEDKNFKCGFIDERGKIVIPCKFAGNISDFNNGVASISMYFHNNNSPWYTGLETKCTINKAGNFVTKFNGEIIEIKQDYLIIQDYHDGASSAYKDGKWALIDKQGAALTSFIYDEISYLRNGLYKAKSDKHYGILSSQGKEIALCKYSNINILNDDMFEVVLYRESYSNKVTKRLLINFEGYIVVKNNEETVLVPQCYDYVSDFVDNYAKVQVGNKWGLIDSSCQLVVECKYNFVDQPQNDYVHVSLDSEEYMLSIRDKSTFKIPKCNVARYYSDNFIIIGTTYPNSDSNRFYIIDKSSNTILDNHYNEFSPIVDGYTIFKVNKYPNEMYGIISTSGKEITPAKFYSLKYIRESKVFLADDKHVRNMSLIKRYVDEFGNTVILDENKSVKLPAKYKSGRNFSCGLAAVAEEYKTKEKPENQRNSNPFNAFWDDDDLDLFLYGNNEDREYTRIRYGFINTQGEEIIPCQFEMVTNFENNFSVFTINSQKGIVDISGNIIIPHIYQELVFLSSDILKAKKNGLWGVISITGEEIIPFSYIEIGAISGNCVSVCMKQEESSSVENNNIRRHRTLWRPHRQTVVDNDRPKGKWGLVNLNNEFVIYPQYEAVHTFHESLAAVKDNNWKYIDENNNVIIDLPTSVNKVSDFVDGKAIVVFCRNEVSCEHILLKNGYLLIDDVEIDITKNNLAFVGDFHEGLAKAFKGNNWGFINKECVYVINDLKTEPSDFNNGISSYEVEDYGIQFININGELIFKTENQELAFPSIYYAIKLIADGLYQVIRKSDSLTGIINSKFIDIVPFSDSSKSIESQSYTNGLGEKSSYIYIKITDYWTDNSIYYNRQGQRIIPDIDGEIVIDSNYSTTANKLSCGLCAVSNNDGQWGFVNKHGQEVISCLYESVREFDGGYCIVIKDNLTGVINTSGEVVVPFGNYEDIKPKGDNVWLVTHNIYGHDTTYQTTEYDGYEDRQVTEHEWISDVRPINSKGEILASLYGSYIAIPKEYSWTGDSFHEGFLSVCKDGKWGVINTRLELIVGCIYDDKLVYDNGYLFAKRSNVTDIINTFGKVVISGEYINIKRYEDFNLFVCLSQNKDRFDIYDIFGVLKFSSSDILSHIIIPGSRRFSTNTFCPSQIVPLSTNYIKFLIKDTYEKRRVESWGICDTTGKVIIDAKFDEIGGCGSGLFSVARYSKENGYSNRKLWGYADLSGNIVIDYRYKNVTPFIKGLAKFSSEDFHWGILTTNGIELTNCVYGKIDYTTNNEVIVSDPYDKNKRNTLTENGLIHYTYFVETNDRGEGDGYDQDVYLKGYDWCSDIHKGLCIVQKGKLYGIISKSGSITFPLSEMGRVKIEVNDNGELSFMKNNEYKDITKEGRIITHLDDQHIIYLPAGIHWCNKWKDNYIEVETNEKWGLLNANLEFVLETKFDKIQYIGNNHVLCKDADAEHPYQIFDIISGETIPLNYSGCSDFENGCAIVSIIAKETKNSWSNQINRDYLYGIIDFTGNELLPCKYRTIQFHEPPKIEHDYSYNNYEEPYYSREDSIMDALDGEADSYWNID